MEFWIVEAERYLSYHLEQFSSKEKAEAYASKLRDKGYDPQITKVTEYLEDNMPLF